MCNSSTSIFSILIQQIKRNSNSNASFYVITIHFSCKAYDNIYCCHSQCWGARAVKKNCRDPEQEPIKTLKTAPRSWESESQAFFLRNSEPDPEPVIEIYKNRLPGARLLLEGAGADSRWKRYQLPYTE